MLGLDAAYTPLPPPPPTLPSRGSAGQVLKKKLVDSILILKRYQHSSTRNLSLLRAQVSQVRVVTGRQCIQIA